MSKLLIIGLLTLCFLRVVFANSGRIIQGSCPPTVGDLSEIKYANYHKNGTIPELAVLELNLQKNIFLNLYYYFDHSSFSHTQRRHWNGVAYPWESIPSVFNHKIFPGFFVVESVIIETINNAIASRIGPCSTRNVNGYIYAAYTLEFAEEMVAKIVINSENNVIVTAYPIN